MDAFFSPCIFRGILPFMNLEARVRGRYDRILLRLAKALPRSLRPVSLIERLETTAFERRLFPDRRTFGKHVTIGRHTYGIRSSMASDRHVLSERASVGE